MENYPTVDSVESKRMPNPAHPLDTHYKSNNITFTSDAGNTQVRQRGKIKRIFSLNYPALTFNQYKTIRDFYLARKGTLEKFSWYHPVEKETIVVRFSNEDLVGKNFSHNQKTPLYALEIKLEEVL